MLRVVIDFTRWFTMVITNMLFWTSRCQYRQWYRKCLLLFRILIISLISKLLLLYKVLKHLYTKIWTRIFENKSKYCLYRRFKVIKEGLRPYFLLQTLEPVQNVNIFAWNSAICFKRSEQSILYRGLILYQLSNTLNYDCFWKTA